MPFGKKNLYLLFLALTLILMLAAMYSIFIYAPIEKTMGIVQKIFYIHVPSAFLAFFAFFITFLASIVYLQTRNVKWDMIAYSSAEIGVVFCTIVLITGPIWAKPVWNVWWTWDPRLTTTLILWFIYVAYLLLRSTVKESQRSNYAAVFGIIGFANVPLTFMATRLWRTIHPVVISGGDMNISGPMQLTLALTFAAFCFLFFSLLLSRVKLENAGQNVGKIRAEADDRLARL
ncbi:MAG: cytochrome c biogenesis protein CcsA [Deltaproteobacteria bacterium]|nr:cytochrome c biogenesis protein CcsA [Deltaproteobacteria bacterium]